MRNECNPSKKRMFAVASVVFLLNKGVLANDTAVGGGGSLPIPISQPHIQMVSELIRISGEELNGTKMNGSWHYDCNFTFKNTSKKEVTISMAFPFPINDGNSEIALPAGQTTKAGQALVYDFLVTVDDKQVSARRGNIAPNQNKGLYYEDAYFWQATFPPLATVKIHHDYITGATYDVMGYHWVHYVLKTGALWQNNTIGHTRLEIIPNTPTRLCSEIDTKADYLETTPPGMKISGSGKNRKYVWDLLHFQPKSDLSLCLFTGISYVRYKMIYSWLNTEDAVSKLAKMSSKELRLLRNTVFAQYGRQFQSPDLQQYFNRQWWYVLNPHYSEDMLNEEDKKLLSMIHQAKQMH
ncbi:hypothetical protein EP47_08625 [Legionella norrlandica]|uniref:YARHG domain-containing protein n=2 Tax=Legionella norrlandica TaxID=1498499 RepID=A0A0A2SW65_9GAMM|nr:hypothetical protein EP47_08625 [Legionella norrlandica]